MTLTPKGKIPKQTLQLSITGSGILDSHGHPIDGNRDGQPGGDFQVTLGKGGNSLAGVSPTGLTGRVSAKAFDTLSVTGQFPWTRGRRPGF
jgi:hypothetical protein